MKILYVSQYFPPEMGAPAARVSQLARHWAAAGHDVTVLTGFPNHPTGVVPRAYRDKLRRLVFREHVDGVAVVRTWLLPLPNGRWWERILNYASFCLSASLTGLFLSRPDVVIATSPQLLVGLAGWWLGKVKRTPIVLEVRDLWPDAIIASGVGQESSALARALRGLSRFLYRACDHLVVVTDAFRQELEEKWGVPAAKMSVIENGVELDAFTPWGNSAVLPGDFGVGRFVVSYIGTLGLAHGLETVITAAGLMGEAAPDVAFLLVGDGADKERLRSQVRRSGASNVHFIDAQPREEVPSLIRSSHVCLVTLKKADVFKTVIPTKMLEFMACGRPVVLAVDGQARRVLEQAGGGLFVEPEDSRALADAVIRLRADPELRRVLGLSGRRFVEANLSREATARQYLGVLETLTDASRS